ncbi:olfactory receptor 2G3-like [Orycteropus afer afer]|uniref:Olfactory receptor n=1 Tax=Orycteropus afer afer TaxID=1230840 RepID=A0A8B7B490_ORYAF|nr:olfactory receptor 2G3-like [Orycteropus afer afer]
MGTLNTSSGGGFILLGFSDQPQLEPIISVAVLLFYLMTLLSNTAIILVSSLHSRLQTPMYYFLTNLSFLDICYTTSIVPQMLVNLWGPKKSITYAGCFLQFFIAFDLGATECLLLAVMAYDRYAAVCQPLRYVVVMHPRFCKKMVAASWLTGLGGALGVSSFIFSLPRCGHHTIDDFFCEIPAFLKIICEYTNIIDVFIYILGVIYLLLPLGVILVSYGVITQAVTKIKSGRGWKKVLNTCGSHLTVVTLFYGSAIYMYLQPQKSSSYTVDKFLSLFYTIITPSLNPLIYTLRNKDVKGALKWLFIRIQSSEQTSTE